MLDVKRKEYKEKKERRNSKRLLNNIENKKHEEKNTLEVLKRRGLT
jgi:hypothetical protein